MKWNVCLPIFSAKVSNNGKHNYDKESQSTQPVPQYCYPKEQCEYLNLTICFSFLGNPHMFLQCFQNYHYHELLIPPCTVRILSEVRGSCYKLHGLFFCWMIMCSVIRIQDGYGLFFSYLLNSSARSRHPVFLSFLTL